MRVSLGLREDPGGVRPRRWPLPLALLLAVSFLFGLRPLSDNNIEFHLHGGRWIVEHGEAPHRDEYTYAAAGRDYVDLHWLFQVVAYGLYRTFGFAGLSVISGLLTAALLWLLALRMRWLGVAPAPSCWVLLASAVIMNYRYLMRPENLSYLYLALLGIILDRYALLRSTDPRLARSAAGGHGLRALLGPWWLWLIPLLHLLWVNTQGLFVLGWGVTAICWLGISIAARRIDRPLALAGAASVVVCLANPYGLTGVLFPLRLLTRFDSSNVFAQHVGEFLPLWSVDWIFEDYLLLVYAVVLFAALAATFKKRRLEDLLLPLPFLALALAGVRNVPLFVIVSAPILARALTDCAPLLPAARARFLGAAIFSIVAVGLALRLLTGSYYLLPGGMAQFRTGVGLDKTVRPFAACAFLLENGLDGRILNSSNIGGWVGWVLTQPAYLDMRLEVMGEDLFQEEVESWKPGGLDHLLAKYRPQLIMADHGAGLGAWSAQLRGREDWRLIYVDEVVAVHARRDYAPHMPTVDVARLAAERGLATARDDATAEELLRRPVPSRARRWLEGFWRGPVRANPLAALGRFSARYGAADAAERLYLESIRIAPFHDHEVNYDLGQIYAASGRPRLALLSYDRFLALSPRDGRVWNERGVAVAALGDPGGAIRDFSRSIDLGPPSTIVFYNRALARRAIGDYRGAREDYSRALRIDPSNRSALFGLEELRQPPP